MIHADPTPCKAQPELFTTPEGERIGSDTYLERVAQAKQFCAMCPVRLECQDEAREKRYEGVWGGEDDIGRAHATGRRIKLPKTPRPPAKCGTVAARRRHKRNGETCWTCAEADRARGYRPRPRRPKATEAPTATAA